MPIIRYFVFVGGLLLALLFAADRYLPAPIERAGPSDPDRTIIRIASARSLPGRSCSTRFSAPISRRLRRLIRSLKNLGSKCEKQWPACLSRRPLR